MTLSELRALSARDSASTDPRRKKAGEWAAKALKALEKKDWTAAIVALAHAIVKCPEGYADGMEVVERVKRASIKTPARAAASRENARKAAAHGKKGGRPRLYPEGCREHARRMRAAKRANPEGGTKEVEQ
jgi:hypothetical protein